MNNWYLLYCKRSEQERAVLNLHRQGVDCYYPQASIEKFVRGKRVQSKEPLFPSYLFVNFDPENVALTTIRSTRGVADFVRCGGKCQVVRDEIVFQLMENEAAMEAADLCVAQAPQEGETFQINKGEFTGLEAIYAEADGEKRSYMLINMLGQQVKISMDNKCLG